MTRRTSHRQSASPHRWAAGRAQLRRPLRLPGTRWPAPPLAWPAPGCAQAPPGPGPPLCGKCCLCTSARGQHTGPDQTRRSPLERDKRAPRSSYHSYNSNHSHRRTPATGRQPRGGTPAPQYGGLTQNCVLPEGDCNDGRRRGQMTKGGSHLCVVSTRGKLLSSPSLPLVTITASSFTKGAHFSAYRPRSKPPRAAPQAHTSMASSSTDGRSSIDTRRALQPAD